MANFNLNKVVLGGRLMADPELKTTPSGVSVTTFTIAVNRRFGGKGEDTQTDFFTVTAWRGTAEFITKFFRKASSICVVGSLQTRSWTDQRGEKRYATEVVAEEAYFVDAKGDSMAGTAAPVGTAAPAGAPPATGTARTSAQAYVADTLEALRELGDEEELPF